MLKTDFLIVGSGIAGLNLALHLAKIGRVLLATKGTLIESNSYLAQGGIAAVTDRRDSFADHIQNTWEVGGRHGKKATIRYLVKNAPKAIRRLRFFGVKFSTEQTQEGGHNFPRVLHTRDETGKTITEALIRQVQKEPRILVLEQTVLLDLVVEKRHCLGGSFLMLKTRRLQDIYAPFTILATGGLGQIFLKTTNPLVTSGDGIAAAKRAGVKIKDLEFVQFHPTALIGKKNPYFLLSETLRGEGAILRNRQGRAFMADYHPLGNMAPRDIVSQVIWQEEKKGPVYLDFRHRTKKYLQERFPNITAELCKNGLDLAKDLIPITPVAHYLCGGIVVNTHGRSSLPGLYALGEVANSGLHGANRLASNSLIEALVLADPIVDDIQKQRKKRLMLVVPPQRQQKMSRARYYPINNTLQRKIKKLMWEKVGIIRETQQLKQALLFLRQIKEPVDFQTKNQLLVAKMVTAAALKRKRSLGVHYIARPHCS